MDAVVCSIASFKTAFFKARISYIMIVQVYSLNHLQIIAALHFLLLNCFKLPLLWSFFRFFIIDITLWDTSKIIPKIQIYGLFPSWKNRRSLMLHLFSKLLFLQEMPISKAIDIVYMGEYMKHNIQYACMQLCCMLGIDDNVDLTFTLRRWIHLKVIKKQRFVNISVPHCDIL